MQPAASTKLEHQQIEIRPANVNDVEGLEQLMFKLHQHHHSAMPEYIKTADEIMAEKNIGLYVANPDCFVYLARYQQQIVGFITGQLSELVSVVSKPVLMGSVDELYIEPKFRNMGIATKLFSQIEKQFVACGVKRVFVEVWHFNDEAINLYQNVGFEHHIHWLCKDIGTG